LTWFNHGRCLVLSCAATLTLALLLTSGDVAPARVVATAHANLRVLTYNVQHLPLEILNKRGSGAYRVQRQVEKFANYDIVGLNEVFRHARRRELIDAMKQVWGDDFHFIAPNQDDVTLFGLDSGLLLLTRFPILESHTLTFGNDSLIRERGPIADGYAKKGALHARIRYQSLAGQSVDIDCFVTHLESVDASRREAQYSLLAEFIKQHAGSQNPVLLLGDFNTSGVIAEIENRDSAYWRLRKSLISIRSDWADLGEFSDQSRRGTANADLPSGGDRIDYIFLANPSLGISLVPKRAAVQRFPDPLVGFLSDHCGVEAQFELK
jgi:endonuclease/exonuclease/phosphatase family metal-dependent hydrolase